MASRRGGASGGGVGGSGSVYSLCSCEGDYYGLPGWRVVVYHVRGGDETIVEVWLRGQIYRAEKGSSAWYHTMTPQEREGHLMSYLKRVVKGDSQKRAANHAEAAEFAIAYPAVWEFLTSDSYEDGAVREVSMICLFGEDGLLKGCLQDRDNQRSLWVTGGTVEAVLKSMEAKVLSGDDSAWRAMRGAYKGARKQGKK